MPTSKWSFGIASGIVIAMLAIAIKVDAQPVQNGASTPGNGNTFTTLTGLQITDTQVGSGASPLPGQVVTVEYSAWVYSNGAKGDVFIPSKRVAFAYATGQAPPVVDQSLATMKVGGKRSVVVPGRVGFFLGPTHPSIGNNPVEVNGPPPPGFIYEINYIE